MLQKKEWIIFFSDLKKKMLGPMFYSIIALLIVDIQSLFQKSMIPVFTKFQCFKKISKPPGLVTAGLRYTLSDKPQCTLCFARH